MAELVAIQRFAGRSFKPASLKEGYLLGQTTWSKATHHFEVRSVNTTMQKSRCTDSVVGDILSSWRYDISGITPEMRQDYEQHLAECGHCSSRQSLHRTIDVVLISLSTASIAAFLLALAVIHHMQPLHHWRWSICISGKCRLPWGCRRLRSPACFFPSWSGPGAVATPAPSYLTNVAIARARILQDTSLKSYASG